MAKVKHDEFNKYLDRIGYTNKARFKWLLGRLNQYRKDRGERWVQEKWDLVCGELAVFTTGEDAVPGYGLIAQSGGTLQEKPSRADAQSILSRSLEAIEHAMEHKPIINLERVQSQPTLLWFEARGRYIRQEQYDASATWLTRVLDGPLAKMIEEHSDRLQRCPAMLPHEEHQCGNFFLKAKRGKFCSTACASREMARAKRMRDEKASQTRKKKGARHGKKGR